MLLKSGQTLEEAIHQQLDPDDPALAEAAEVVKALPGQVWFQPDPHTLDAEDAKESMWYRGATHLDKRWEFLKASISENILASVDHSSTKVVSRLANPHVQAKKRGLVLGYVQSGKTANYAAAVAKAADAGYKIIIVLAGMHDNLRNQTQARLDRDLGLGNQSPYWQSLTHAEQDFTGTGVSVSVLNGETTVIAVVKKNKSRLVKLLNWLKELPRKRLERAPILLLDDEADQATPNSSTNQSTISAINSTLRQIWEVIPTGTYLAYTATPFANVFMDPDEETDLFPADFLLSLPRPDNYFGAERIFGSAGHAEGAEPSDGLDMVRKIPETESTILRPGRSEKDGWEPQLPKSLTQAINWFLVATAIRRARGQFTHNSMLIHTSQFVVAHAKVAESVEQYVAGLRAKWDDQSTDEIAKDLTFAQLFADESERAASVRSKDMPAWNEVAQHLYDAALDCKVIIDNGPSTDRLNYNHRDDGGRSIPQTVIAVGGATLSRGLTLEGLMVSYFSRPATTYDTLLQMGRWFGYRVGYEDLPRVWMTEQLEQEFVFLATVEQDLRVEVDYLETTGRTPRDAGVRVREHPGRLAITGAAKMRKAKQVALGLSGVMQQTFVFEEHDAETILVNQQAVRDFVKTAKAGRSVASIRNGRHLIKDVDTDTLIKLLDTYQFHKDQSELMPQLMIRWLRKAASTRPWNVVVASPAKDTAKSWDGKTVQLGQLDIGLDEPVNTVNRAPMRTVTERANVKALLSLSDRVADLSTVGTKDWTDVDFRLHRDSHAENRGLLLIYPVSRHSVPTRAVGKNPSRRPMVAPEHLVGLGLVFPNGTDVGLTSNDWVSVRNRYDTQLVNEQEEIELEVDAEEGNNA